MADKLKKAKLLRNTCLSEIQILYSLSSRAKDDKSVHSLFKVRYSEIDDVREEFNKHHSTIIGILLQDADADLNIEDLVREGFLSEYFAVKTVYSDLFENDVAAGNNSRTGSLGLMSNDHVRLPKIDLIKFSGDYTTFSSYIDLYDALVHNNAYLGDIEKFNYLLSSLQGDPLALVRTLPLTADNYAIAYETLLKRYSNKRLRAQAHWAQIEGTSRINTDNVTALRRLLDTFTENLAALHNLQFPVAQWDFILVMMLLKRLDIDTATRFELEHSSTDVPTFDSLKTYLNKRCVALDTLSFSQTNLNKRYTINNKSQNNATGNKVSTFFTKPNVKPTPSQCTLCKKENHPVYTCSEFLKKTPTERYNYCKGLHLCFNCLSNVHQLSKCKSTYVCRFCSKKHHSTLCLQQQSSGTFPLRTPAPSNTSDSPTLSNDNPQQIPSHSNSSFHVKTGVVSQNAGVLLSTAAIEVLNSQGTYIKLRALLDSGSMTSFISKTAANLLGLPKSKSVVEVKGVGSMNLITTHGCVSLNFRPVGECKPTFSTDAIIINKICDQLPAIQISIDNWQHLALLNLADNNFNAPGNIDLLLGADVFSEILLDGRIVGKTGLPDAINTVFGYVIMGKYETLSTNSVSSFMCTNNTPQLNDTLKKFWELEMVPDVRCISPEDEQCETFFNSTCRRDETGRFIVSLPFKEPCHNFPGSRSLAVKRLYSLERRLMKDPSLHKQYCDFMEDYLTSTHMELVEGDCNSDTHYYIPHHCVINPNSITTKLRVVFDASAKPLGNKSLNDYLMTGPKLQKDICSILLTFRLHQYVMCADIRQMYRMILISEDHRDFQRIVWRFSPAEPVKDYRLTTVTYGIKSSPYLALRTLIELANNDGKSFPLACNAIYNDTYVDDIVTGCSSIDEAHRLQSELINLFAKGGFELRKWSSNEFSLLSRFSPSQLCKDPLSFDTESNSDALKVLGLRWNPVADSFSFRVQPTTRSCTKRHLLSQLSKCFDPLGLLSPLSFFTKYLIQQLWCSGHDWDQPVGHEIMRVWQQYTSELPLISDLHIPRKILPATYSSCELHGFGDASERGYAAVIYLRVILLDGTISVHFLCSKSKVAPLKRISIPRLELCAAALLSKLMSYVMKVYEGKLILSKTFSWSDSKIVLVWINTSPHLRKTFVANRISYIQNKIPASSWYHVKSENNPADLASRGLLPSALLSNQWWFAGPHFLSEPGSHWVHSDFTEDDVDLPPEEQNKSTLTAVIQLDNPFINQFLNKYSSFSIMQRIMSYILRFIHNAKFPAEKRINSLSSFELHNALMVFVKCTQQVSFSNELKRDIFSKPFRKLNPFIDDQGIIRVGGRLSYSNEITYEQKFPILLPRCSRLTDLLITFYHEKYLHVGLTTVQFLLSQSFWILSPKRAIRSVLSRCLKCWKTNPKPLIPRMGNLPRSRISQAKPFIHSGVDFAGPIQITMNRYRGNRTCKAYICIFVCFAVKAVHLELVSSLSSDAFLAALQRFMGRRGKIEKLSSDNGTNFVGANKQLMEFMKSAAQHEQISWSFLAPGSPHMGGLWEAGVKSVKTHLYRVVGQQILTYEELYTVLVLIESVLNSRPLTPVSSDPNDLSVLTPGHFLTMEPLTAIPTPDYVSEPMNRLSRWQLIQRLHQDFWKRYHKEYLHTLQQRGKWTDLSTPVKPGILVLIKQENISPLQWPVGRIKSLFSSQDNIARVAVVETATGTFRRPLVKLCPLPIYD